MVNDLLQS